MSLLLQVYRLKWSAAVVTCTGTNPPGEVVITLHCGCATVPALDTVVSVISVVMLQLLLDPLLWCRSMQWTVLHTATISPLAD